MIELFLDDMRAPILRPNVETIVFKEATEMVQYLHFADEEMLANIGTIYLDHDLHADHYRHQLQPDQLYQYYTRIAISKEIPPTGYFVAVKIAKTAARHDRFRPTVVIHTKNLGAQVTMKGSLLLYGYPEELVEVLPYEEAMQKYGNQ